MRDKRRADDSCRDSHYRRGELERDRRSAFTDDSIPQRTAGSGVNIKGRATGNRASQSPTRADHPVERGRSHREVLRKAGPSPHREYNREKPPKRTGDKSFGNRRHYRGDSNFSPTQGRTPFNSPSYGEVSSHKFTRKKSASPGRRVISRRKDRSTSSNRGRDYSPSRGTKAGHHSYHHNRTQNPTDTVVGDAYSPVTKRHRVRSPTSDPDQTPSSKRRGAHSSRNISQADNKPLSQNYQHSGRDWISRKQREPDTSRYHRKSRSRDHSPHFQDTRRRRREHRSSSPAESGRNRQRSRSPQQVERAPAGRNKKMQPSTRPIQSILDEGSRQPSPPRPIPSFDSDSHDSGGGGGREAYSMHGMKAGEMHGSIRSGRAPQIDTRQSYSTSPQWTPTSSHHGSPQSGSPFSHGRAAWNGPSQHFQGQQK